MLIYSCFGSKNNAAARKPITEIQEILDDDTDDAEINKLKLTPYNHNDYIYLIRN
jgi:ribosomal protein L20A (L18A)